MVRYALAAALTLLTVTHFPQTSMADLPTPHYREAPGDPDWLAYAAQFHGHLGPWATAGARIGMAARHAVAAQGHFDVDVTVAGPLVKPPTSCFLDGVQVSTGATWGKRNIHWTENDHISVRIRNTRSGEVIEARPTPTLMDLLGSMKAGSESPQRHDHALEEIARKIATLPASELVQFSSPEKPSADAEP